MSRGKRALDNSVHIPRRLVVLSCARTMSEGSGGQAGGAFQSNESSSTPDPGSVKASIPSGRMMCNHGTGESAAASLPTRTDDPSIEIWHSSEPRRIHHDAKSRDH